MKNNEILSHAKECHCLSWKPIIVGALVAIGLSFLLNLFSVAIGLSAFSTNSGGAETLVFGGLLGTAIGIVASMFAAGWLTGYLGQRHCSKRHLGALYGFLAWCLALLATIFLSAHIQEYVFLYGHFLSGVTEAGQYQSAAPAKVAALASSLSNKNLVISTYIIFVLFFLSAFSCSLGGHCGMNYICKDENK